MLDFVLKHKEVLPEVEVYSFEDFHKAYSHLFEGKARYRTVIKV